MPPIVVFIEGNIGTGKTTLLSALKEKVPKCQIINEPLEMWRSLSDSSGSNILNCFYKDPHKYAYAFQSFAFLSRFQMLKEIDHSCKYVFIERSIHSDKHIFAKNCYESGLITDMEWVLYNKWFDLITENMKSFPFVHLYLRCETEVAHERQKNRGRDEESNLTIEYMRSIHDRHEEWLCKDEKVIVVDVNDLSSSDLAKKAFAAIENFDESSDGPSDGPSVSVNIYSSKRCILS